MSQYFYLILLRKKVAYREFKMKTVVFLIIICVIKDFYIGLQEAINTLNSFLQLLITVRNVNLTTKQLF